MSSISDDGLLGEGSECISCQAGIWQRVLIAAGLSHLEAAGDLVEFRGPAEQLGGIVCDEIRVSGDERCGTGDLSDIRMIEAVTAELWLTFSLTS